MKFIKLRDRIRMNPEIWVCTCGKVHHSAHVAHLLTFRRQPLWCPHCGRTQGPNSYTWVDAIKGRSFQEIVINIPGVYFRNLNPHKTPWRTRSLIVLSPLGLAAFFLLVCIGYSFYRVLRARVRA